MSSADVLTLITHRISEVLNGSLIMRAIAIDIWKVFDKVQYRELLHKISCYGISERVYTIILR